MTNDDRTPVKQRDFLEVDDPIRGQAFACISIITPENILDNKDAYFFNKYISKFSSEVSTLFDVLRQKYPDDDAYIKGIIDSQSHFFKHQELQDSYRMFTKLNMAALEDEFHKANGFRTTVRGLKVRGCYSSLDEARERATLLQRKDPQHNVWVAEVGAWVPFTDNPEAMKDMEYAETELNTLMKKYTENVQQSSTFFEERKKVMCDGKQPEQPKFLSEKDPWLLHKNA